MRVFSSVFIFLISVCVAAQINEDFADGDFSDGNPLTWSPSQLSGADDFAIASGKLNSNGPAATSTLFISSSQRIDFVNNDVVWTFKVRYSFAPSGSNNVEVYLISDISDLSSSPNGYYIRLGESGSTDGIDLFKTNSGAAIIPDAGDLIASSIDAHIRVTRSSLGNWTLEADDTGGNSFVSIGSIIDTDFTSGNNFGFLVNHTSGRNQSFFFDDFTITVTPIPDTTPPGINNVSAVSSTSVDVTFNEDVDQTTAENSANYSVNGGINVISAQRDALDHSMVHLTISALNNGTDYSLTVDNVEDESGNAIASPIQTDFTYLVLSTATFRDIQINEFMADPAPSLGILPEEDFVELYNPTSNYYDLLDWQVGDSVGQSGQLASFILEPDSYVIICSNSDVSDFQVFGDVLGVSSFPNFNSSSDDGVILYDNVGTIVDHVAYTGSDVPDDGITLEQVNPELLNCAGVFNFAPSLDANGGTPNEVNSVLMPDILGPNLVSVFAITEDSLQFDFDEVIDAATVQINDFTFLPSLITADVQTLADYPQSVFVKLGEAIEGNSSFEVTVTGIKDCLGNEVVQGTVSFSRLVLSTPGFRDIQINEFIANSSPSEGLPEADFVELYNPTSNFYNLAGWQIGDANSQSGGLSNYVLEPNNYVIICKTSDVMDFEIFGKALGVTSFPNFNSSSDDVVIIYDDIGSIVDLIAYTGDDLGENGISLEQINPNLGCSGIFNFEPSLDEDGGTPGMENSVFMIVPDNFGPTLLLANAISNDSLRLDFDEILDPSTIGNASVTFQPSVTVQAIYGLDNYPQSIFFKTSEAIEPNTTYQVTVSGIKDCAGNNVEEATVSLILGLEPEADDILLSEILFNPVIDGSDFVEIYNPSATENFELRGWKIARLQDGVVDNEEPIAPEGLLMSPGQFLVFTDDVSDLGIQYPGGNSDVFVELSGFPSYSNDQGSVVLINDDEEIVQQFDYLDDYHYELLEDVEGVSLERVSYDRPVNDSNNWRSAASTVGFGTPGNVNSQSIESVTNGGQLTIEPKVFIPGNSGSGRDFTTINYSFNQGGKFANVIIYDQNGRQVKELANGASLSASGFYRWDGTTDRGSIARMGYFVVMFEVYDGNGNRSIMKETVVVGRDF